ncbi:MAG TPA: hypothetical protein DD490_25720 [Acidobacteria bacterium]|nr:hypothetical protein [Acidobacteriota bacterium]
MLGHYLKVAARHLLKHKGTSLIHLLGLTLGVACCLLILLFVRDELSFDRSFSQPDRLFRITEEAGLPGQEPKHAAITPPRLAPVLAQEMPEIAEAARLLPYFEGSLPGKAAISYRNEKQFYDSFFWADPNIFRLFTLPMVEGDADKALTAPNTVVLGAATARRYFGTASPLGKVLRIDSGFSDEDYTITGVVEDMPASSHFHFAVLASISTVEHIKDPRIVLDEWWLADAYTYVRLAEGATAAQVEAKMPAFIAKHFPAFPPGMPTPRVSLYLQPVTSIHLHSNLLHELEVNGDVAYVYVFSAVALLVLLIACVNFMNLSTARFAHRAREVAMRKALGARRPQLIAQFLGEAILLAVLATGLAVLLVRLALPAFNAFAGKAIVLSSTPSAWLGLAALAVLAGAAAGIYPAFFLSSFPPALVLKSSPAGGATRTGSLRKILIVCQFAAAVALLIGTAVIWQQLRHMRSRELGFNARQVLVLPIRDVALRDSFTAVKTAMERLPGVLGTTFSSLLVSRETPEIGVQIEGIEDFDSIGTLIIDPDFLKVFQIGLAAGRGLDRNNPADLDAGFLVNEAAVRRWGLGSPREALGRKVAWGGWKAGTIVGVVRDFHHQPVRHDIKPLMLHVRPLTFHYLYVRLAPEDRAATIGRIEDAWRRLRPSKPFEAFFLEDEMARAYRPEERLGQLIGFFALAAIFVACLGLLGLVAFSAGQRTREIGIRKALGSSVAGIVMLLTREMAGLVLAANLIAWPLAWLVLRAWLSGFPDRVGLSPLIFLAASCTALLVAWLTVSLQALRAALIDPAAALRGE